MAITPWSWTKSNGTATAAQTKAAYDAITSKGYTYSFSRKVWNDLVSKINETAVALGKGWSDEILSLSETKMHYLYSSLSAKMFNSARLNTNYRVWSWSTDETKSGYVGRDDFRGVGVVGEADADFVYGRYFLELTERLNLVIDIVNGGGQSIELKETIGMLTEIASELVAVASQRLGVKFNCSFQYSASMETEKQNTWILHFTVDAPTSHAVLEIGNYNFCEASVYISPSIVRTPRTSPSEPFVVRFYFPQEFKTEFTLDPSKPFHVDYVDTPTFQSELTQETPQPMSAAHSDIIDSEGNMIQIETQTLCAFDCERLMQSAVITQERMGLFMVRGIIHNYIKSTAKADRSSPASAEVLIKNIIEKHTAHVGHSVSAERTTDMTLSIESEAHTGYAPVAEYSVPLELRIERTAHAFPTESAEYKHTEHLNINRSMDARQAKPITSHTATIEHSFAATLTNEHMGFFLAVMKTAMSIKARLAYLGSFPLAIAHLDGIQSKADFSLEIIEPIELPFVQKTTAKADMQSEDLPTWTIHHTDALTWHTDFTFLEGQGLSFSEPIELGYMPNLQQTNCTPTEHKTDITVDPVADAEAKILRFITITMKERLNIRSNAKVGTAKPQTETVSITSDSSATLDHAAGIQELHINHSDAIAERGVLDNDVPYPLNAFFRGSVGQHSELGFIRYGYLCAEHTEAVGIKADIITTGNWIYPAKVGTDLLVVQVYEPEAFDNHEFFDFGKYKAAVDSVLTMPTAMPDMQYRKDTGGTFGCTISAFGDINFVDISAWEHPVQTETDLYISQVAFANSYERKLEVR